jgi:hypothetical protein
MNQLTTKDGEPLLQYLSVENEEESIIFKRKCPFLGLAQDEETVMAFPATRNHCHRLRPAESVRLDYQRTHCLTFAHRHCPVLLEPSPKKLPRGIAYEDVRRRSIFVVLGVASLFMLLVIAFMLFGGWQRTSANDWFSDPDSVPTQEENIELPTELEIHSEQYVPTLLPTEFLPASELPIEALDSNQTPEPTITPSLTTET